MLFLCGFLVMSDWSVTLHRMLRQKLLFYLFQTWQFLKLIRIKIHLLILKRAHTLLTVATDLELCTSRMLRGRQ